MVGALTQFSRRLKAATIAFRSYEGAGAGRRWRGVPEIAHQGAAMTAARGPVGRRARALVANNALAASGVEAWVSNVVGAGIKPQSQHPDPAIHVAINSAWDRWTDQADADGLVDFHGLTAMVVRRMVVDGDVFAAPTMDGAGQDVKFSDPATIGAESIDFLRLTIRHIAAGLGVPYEVLTGDLSQVNFSSIRAGLLEFRRRVEAIQNNVIIFQFCRPIWEQWLTVAALSGEIDARGFARDPRAFRAAKWITPRREFVDPLKDARAEIESINAGVMSRREAVAARGWDVETLDVEIAADHERAKKLGLHFAVPHSPIDPAQEAAQ